MTDWGAKASERERALYFTFRQPRVTRTRKTDHHSRRVIRQEWWSVLLLICLQLDEIGPHNLSQTFLAYFMGFHRWESASASRVLCARHEHDPVATMHYKNVVCCCRRCLQCGGQILSGDTRQHCVTPKEISVSKPKSHTLLLLQAFRLLSGFQAPKTSKT